MSYTRSTSAATIGERIKDGPGSAILFIFFTVDVDRERCTEVFTRLEFGGEQVAQRVESSAACAAQRRRVIAHESFVPKLPGEHRSFARRNCATRL